MFLSYSDVSAAATVAIATLDRLGVTACFVGGMACKLYGNDRTPEDLDILCLGCRWDQEELKRRVVAANPSFYLISAKKPGATYKVLWYRANYASSRCKVDLLLPGIMDIPLIPTSAVDRTHPGKPCAPFGVVFLLKLQAWQQHRDSDEVRWVIKASTDALDIRRLLPIAVAKGFNIQRAEAYLPPSFVASAQSRAKKFVKEWSETRHWWKALGFSVREERMTRDLVRDRYGLRSSNLIRYL